MQTMGSIVRALLSFDEYFEPYCAWERDEARVTLVIHLPEFKKEQLRVHVTCTGILKISGERAVSETKRSCFKKEVRVLMDWNADEIHAKFSAGHLRIIIPKNPLPSPEQRMTVRRFRISKKTTVKVAGVVALLAAAAVGVYCTFKYWISDEE